MFTKKQANNLTFGIRVFDKKVDLPKRYELLASGPTGETLVFSTSLNTQDDYQKQLGCKSKTVITGNIEIGNRKNCELCDEKALLKSGFDIVRTLGSKKLHYIEAGSERSNLGVFYNKDNYMYIIDENKKLTFDIYQKLILQLGKGRRLD